MNIKESTRLIKSGSLLPLKFELIDVFSDLFMQENTTCKNFQEMLDKNNIVFNGQQEFENINITVIDSAVKSCSQYQSWVEFLQAAIDNLLQ